MSASSRIKNNPVTLKKKEEALTVKEILLHIVQKALKSQQHVAVRGTSSSIRLPPVSLIIYGSNNDKRRRGKSLLQSSGGIKIPAARIKMSLMERRERERERKKNPETVSSFLYFLHVSPLPVNLILRQRGSRAGRENSPLLPQLVQRSGTAVINAKSVLIACSLSHKKKTPFLRVLSLLFPEDC